MRIGLLGTKAGPRAAWCVEARRLIAEQAPGVEVWDPSDPAWEGIDWDAGGEIQPVVDGIATRQLEGIAACDLLVIYIGDEHEGAGARFEIGRLLWTPGLRIFLVLHPKLRGRHYIRAFLPHARADVWECQDLATAVAAAVANAVGT